MAFLGGPLHFLTELKAAFIRTLKLDDEHAITPENSHLFAAIGSALNYKEDVITSLSALIQKLSGTIHMEFEVARMDPLFASKEEYEEFSERQSQYNVMTGDLKRTKETAILVLMPDLPRQKLLWSEKTVLCFILSTVTTTAAR